jgi:hypothetical protein
VRVGDFNEELWHRAYTLLALHNRDERKLSVRNAIGCPGVRGGTVLTLDLDEFQGRARVSKCVHRLSAGQHFMDLDVVI